jgi:3-phosphoshikimate 1-carboxyvinyltransferase
MQAILTPSKIQGSVIAPASKSAMQRACALALIKRGQTILHNPGVSADDHAALDIISQLGATVQTVNDTLVIDSKGVQPIADTIHCGESGLSVRMFTPLAALSFKEITVTGQGSLLQRPLNFFDEVLPQVGVSCTTQNGRLPMVIKGPLQPANIEVDGSLSSQFLTGLLLAYAAAGAQDVTITVRRLNSKPYIDLTLQLMRSFGLRTPENRQYEKFYFPAQSSTAPSLVNYTVEGDWSGGAFLLVAGALAGSITIHGLDVFSTQADKAILQALMQTGAVMSITEKQIDIGPAPLQPFHLDATDCPDLFPPLVALASACSGRSVIEGVHRLAHKESNRALTLQEEFGKMGVPVLLQDDLMVIDGSAVKSAEVSSHHDHRIAMACAVAALRADGPVTINGAEAVNKSYPQFWQHLSQLKAELSLNNN